MTLIVSHAWVQHAGTVRTNLNQHKFSKVGTYNYMFRHGVSEAIEVDHHLWDIPVVDDVASRQHQEFVDGVQDPVTGLVDRQENRAMAKNCHL